ncbi:MAG TPA: hypothetical protein VFX23_10090 [Limnobacter sp.]|nr:hypothetical protein [Limnobacter sp.]
MTFVRQLGVLLLFVCVGCSAAQLDPQRVKNDLQNQPAETVIKSLKRQNKYQQVLKRIAEGQAEWVALAPALYMGTDAGDSDDLEIALATALPKNAVAVLSDLNPSKADGASSLRIDHVCGVPFIEPTDAFVKAYLLQSTKAVKAVKDEKLLPVARQCLSYLK